MNNHGFRIPCQTVIARKEQMAQRIDVHKPDCHWYHNQKEGVALCKFNEMRPCIYEVGGFFCEEYNDILEERRGG